MPKRFTDMTSVVVCIVLSSLRGVYNMTREDELLKIVLTGTEAETKLALEELDKIRVKVKPVKVKGGLAKTYTCGDWIAEVYVQHSETYTESEKNIERSLRHNRGAGLISQPTFYREHRGMERDATVRDDKKFTVNGATILFTNTKTGSMSTRKVYARRDKFTYRDGRFDKAVSRNEFVKSFPQAFWDEAELMVHYMEFMAPAPFERVVA